VDALPRPFRPPAHPGYGLWPGLDAERLAALGHEVTGVDVSANSIRHARESAQAKGLPITYHNRSFLSLEYLDGMYDLVYMVFTDMAVLSPQGQGRRARGGPLHRHGRAVRQRPDREEPTAST